MKLRLSSSALILLLLQSSCEAWVSSSSPSRLSSPLWIATEPLQELSHARISKLRFRELQKELTERNLEPVGTTAQLRTRLRELLPSTEECVVEKPRDEDVCEVSQRFRGSRSGSNFIDSQH